MTKKHAKTNQYDLSGIAIDDLISKPLTAIVDAQSKMAKEQVKNLLDTCFKFNGEYYEPKVIKLTITRAVIADNKEKTPEIEQISTTFDLPLITIFPINSLAIEEVEIHFNIDVSTQYLTEIESGEENSIDDKYPIQKAQIKGKVASSRSTESTESSSIDTSTSYSIDVVASPLPLPPGLLTIIDVYTKAIEPTKMPEIES